MAVSRPLIAAAIAAALIGGAAAPLVADAYPAPSGLGTSTTLCAPRPADAGTAQTPVSLTFTAALAADNYTTPAVSPVDTNLGAGAANLYVYGPLGSEVQVQAEDATNIWYTVALVPTVSSSSGNAVQTMIEIPNGPIRLELYNGPSSAAGTVYAGLSEAADPTGDRYIEQELADACQLSVINAAARSTQLSTLATDLTQIDADLDANASQAHSDAQAIEKELTTTSTTSTSTTTTGTGTTSSSTTSTSSSTTPAGTAEDVDVQNFPADQTVGDDQATLAAIDAEAKGVHEDIWVLIAVVVGCFALGFILVKALP